MGKMNEKAKEICGRDLTAGKEKITLPELVKKYPEGISITGVDFVTNEKDETYPVMTFAEDDKKYFNGSKGFRDKIEKLLGFYNGDIAALNADLAVDPLEVQVFATKTRAGNNYYAVKVL